MLGVQDAVLDLLRRPPVEPPMIRLQSAYIDVASVLVPQEVCESLAWRTIALLAAAAPHRRCRAQAAGL